MARTYIENTLISELPEEYSEQSLKRKFAQQLVSLNELLRENMEASDELSLAEYNDANATSENKIFAPEEIRQNREKVDSENHKLSNEFNVLKQEYSYLQEYGPTFSQLYRIREEHIKKGYAENVSFVEEDIIDNGDILTQEQYFKMNADPEGRLKQLALQVEVPAENGAEQPFKFSLGIMEYDVPNEEEQKLKMQITFSEQVAADLDKEQLGEVLDFCEKSGFETDKMEVRAGESETDEEIIAAKERISALIEELKAEQKAQGEQKDLGETQIREEHQKELDKEYQEIIADGGKTHDEQQTENTVSEKTELNTEEKADAQNPNDKKNAENNSVAKPDKNDITPDLPTAGEIGVVGFSEEETAVIDIDDKDVAQNSIFSWFHRRNNNNNNQPAQQPAGNGNNQTPNTPPAPQGQNAPAPHRRRRVRRADVEEKFDEWLGTSKGLNKVLGKTLFKKHSGWFGTGWTVYTVYDGEVTDEQRRKEGKVDDKGKISPYLYSFKLFIREKNGTIQIGYRTPNNKKLDEAYINGIIGQLESLGITHVNFPMGMPDAEKGLWRKALAEKGMIPVGIGLDRSKMTGMLEAGKPPKLSDEKYALFKFRLGTQAQKNNRQKHKRLDDSEQSYIDGLINSYHYRSFTNGYAETLKPKIKTILRTSNPDTGAVDKIAAFRTLRILFDAYNDVAPKSNYFHDVAGRPLLSSDKLSMAEKQALQNAGLGGSVDKMSTQQLKQVFDILYPRQQQIAKDDVYRELIDVRFNPNIGAKRADQIIVKDIYNNARNMCDGINEDLKSLGLDEIDMIKSFNVPLEIGDFVNNYLPNYQRTHPQPNRNNQPVQQPNNNQPNTNGGNAGNNQPNTPTGGQPQVVPDYDASRLAKDDRDSAVAKTEKEVRSVAVRVGTERGGM